MTPVIQRRAFICNAGAALSATVAATAVTEATTPTSPDASNDIRQLHHTLVERLNERQYAELRELFASDGAPSDPRPRAQHFHRPQPECTQHPVHDHITPHAQHLDTIEVAPNQLRATARFHCLTRLEAALTSTIPLVEMARQQGQGAIQWWEAGVLESTYIKLASGWKITRLAFRATGPWRTQL
jgi:SnoaL-like domain